MHRKHARVVHCLLALGLPLVLSVHFSVSRAQTITSSGLNTTVSAPIVSIPSGKIQINITDGTRPGGGANLFHSFGELNVPTNTTANFLNNTGLPTSNILGRVTGGNLSSIYGIIQTTGFGNANLFLMNPAGFLFGPNATVNVGGMVSFTSADYLTLADGARFSAIPNASADALLSAAPVAAFGFLGSNPGAITVQGSHLTVTEGTGISLVGGNITVDGGTLTAPSGSINVVSVSSPSKPNVGGEVLIAGSGERARFTPTGFRSLGTFNLTQVSTIDVSANGGFPNNGLGAGNVLIRGGQFVMDSSSIEAVTRITSLPKVGNVEITADQIALSNGSRIATSHNDGAAAGNITFNANTFSATDSAINADGFPFARTEGGAVTIQGLQGSSTSARSVSLSNTNIFTGVEFGPGGPITVRGDNISMNDTSLATASPGLAGPITLVGGSDINIQDSGLFAGTDFGQGGTVALQAGKSLSLSSTTIDAHGGFDAGSISMAASTISLGDSTVFVTGGIFGGLAAGTISLTGKNAVSLTNGTVLSANGNNHGGTVLINGGANFTSQDSTISAKSISGDGGTIRVDAKKVDLSNSQLNTSTTGGQGRVGGSTTVDAKKMTVTNSQILSTATEGQGGTITITSPSFHQDATSVIDASSQFGTNGTVTINGIVQP
jgi:filamentous hemagglutinin family protein